MSMKRKIVIDGQEVPFRASAAIPRFQEWRNITHVLSFGHLFLVKESLRLSPEADKQCFFAAHCEAYLCKQCFFAVHCETCLHKQCFHAVHCKTFLHLYYMYRQRKNQ